MKTPISPRFHVLWLSILLIIVSVSIVFHKRVNYGFPLTAKHAQDVWTVEAEISYFADNKPVKVSFSLPGESEGYRILDEHFASPGYGFRLIEADSEPRRGEWTTREASGSQRIFYRAQFYKSSDIVAPDEARPEPIPEYARPYWEDAERLAVEAILSHVRSRSADSGSFVAHLAAYLNHTNADQDQNTALLLSNTPDSKLDASLFKKLLLTEGIPVRQVRGLSLSEGRRYQPLVEGIEFFDGKRWIFVEPVSGTFGIPSDFLLWQRGGVSLIDLEGGLKSRVRMSVIKDTRPAQQLAQGRLKRDDTLLMDFSIYSLPIEEQNVFKHLLLIPIGAFVIILLRNVVGIVTSGTFMPILVALAFQETKLIPGILLFVLIVAAGLGIRSMLAHLNLLVVPRISAVVIVVILLMAALSVLSNHLHLPWGMKVTFFPMIIIAWTIERLSIIWEEEGCGSALMQGGGSLLVAIIAYLVMSNAWVRHITFTFPEVLLLVLAAILHLGQYSGYRLTELRRFEPFLNKN